MAGREVSRHVRSARRSPAPSWWRVLAGVARGLVAVVVLVVTAVDALVTAVIGTAPVLPRLGRAVRWLGREIARETGDAFRGGRAGVVDAEVIDDERRVWR